MEDLESELLNIKREYLEKKNYYSEIISGIFTSVLYKIERICMTVSENDSADNRIDEIIKYITENYMSDISNEKISEYFNYHPNYINKLIKRHTNMSLHQYVLSYRLSVSLKLIQTTVIPISEIAAMSGFNDFSHFSKYFKKKIGRNPTDFRHSNSDLLV